MPKRNKRHAHIHRLSLEKKKKKLDPSNCLSLDDPVTSSSYTDPPTSLPTTSSSDLPVSSASNNLSTSSVAEGSSVADGGQNTILSEVLSNDDTSQSDCDFDPDSSLLLDHDAMIGEFAEDWVASLRREDLYSLSLLLFHILRQEFLLQVYPASKIIAKYVDRYVTCTTQSFIVQSTKHSHCTLIQTQNMTFSDASKLFRSGV